MIAASALTWSPASPSTTAARASQRPASRFVPVPDTLTLPAGTSRIRIEYLDGIVLLPATLTGVGGRDTSGTLVLDTGAGALALDAALARTLGVADSDSVDAAVTLAPRALPSLALGTRTMGSVSPILSVDMRPVWSAIDRHPLGLLGQAPIAHGALVLDVDTRTLSLVPPPDSSTLSTDPVAASRAHLGASLTARASPVPFRMGGDEKILVSARILDRPTSGARIGPPAFDSLTLILDTGATKCVLFQNALGPRLGALESWPAMRGLSAPTLFGAAPARVVLLPVLQLVDDSVKAVRTSVDALVIGGALSEALQRAVGEPVHGLLGDSFLRHFRITIDYEHRVLWLEPRPVDRNARPFEYSQPGMQLERSGGGVVVSGVVAESPASRAGIAPGDRVVRVNRMEASRATVLELAKALEGPPGTKVKVRVSHAGRERTVGLVRRWLLPESM